MTKTDRRIARRRRQMLRTLGRELFQTETSAAWHCRREARRLGMVPPALALESVADHAEGTLRELPELARRHDMPISSGGHLTGRLFSAVRQVIVDRFIEAERSYRGTLLGIRHGVDLVRLIQHVAVAQQDQGLARWCAGWLSVRTALSGRIEDELAWFARNPIAATAGARSLVERPA